MGRLSGIFVSKIIKPRTMIVTSLLGCLGAAMALVALGAKSVMSVYAGTCAYLSLHIVLNRFHSESTLWKV